MRLCRLARPPAEIISHAVWLHLRVPLSLRGFNHTGFEWSCAGSGAQQLAAAPADLENV